MKINFTKDEYRHLLDLVYLGDWVMTADDVGKNVKKKHHEEITQKIYSYAKDFGCEDLIEFNAEFDKYNETRDFEESEVSQCLAEFEENCFWETLISRLAERDFLKELPPGGLNALSLKEKFTEIQKHEDKWADEFSKFGIDHLKIKET